MARSVTDYIRERTEAFQRIKAHVLARYFVPGMALTLAAIAALLLEAPTWLQLGFFAPAFVLFMLGSNKYRCPVCNRTPAGEGGIDFNPRQCGHCGTLLRSDDEV
jgi:membrane protein implicated in regulation of membrane protease activity